MNLAQALQLFDHAFKIFVRLKEQEGRDWDNLTEDEKFGIIQDFQHAQAEWDSLDPDN